MFKTVRFRLPTVWPVILLAGFAVLAAWAGRQKPEWTKSFPVDKSELSSSGRSTYFILEPGYRLELVGGDERLAVTVLNETETVDGVETRVVEERETEGGQLIEISRNFFAIHKPTGDVYYFGEDVDIYRNGKVVGHGGAWRSGEKGAKFGLMMPGKPRPDQAFYQEVAPKVAMDRVRVVSTKQKVKTPAGTFENCLKVEETTPLEPGVKEYKLYAPEVGLIVDAGLKLVKVVRL